MIGIYTYMSTFVCICMCGCVYLYIYIHMYRYILLQENARIQHMLLEAEEVL